MRSTGKAEEEIYRMQAEFCKGMAHPKRIHILRVLEDGEMTVNELARITGVSQANVSQHLGILRQLGLLQTRRNGSNVYYSVADHRVVEACDLVRSCIGERLKRSRQALEVSA